MILIYNIIFLNVEIDQQERFTFYMEALLKLVSTF